MFPFRHISDGRKMHRIYFPGPDIPTVNAHGEIIGIDHHIAQKSPLPKQIHENERAYNSGGIYQDIFLFRVTNRQKPKNYRNYLQKYKKGPIAVILLKKEIKNGLHNRFGQILRFSHGSIRGLWLQKPFLFLWSAIPSPGHNRRTPGCLEDFLLQLIRNS